MRDDLAPFGDDTLDLYRLLCRATVPLALERGAIDRALARRFDSLLEPAHGIDDDPSHG